MANDRRLRRGRVLVTLRSRQAKSNQATLTPKASAGDAEGRVAPTTRPKASAGEAEVRVAPTTRPKASAGEAEGRVAETATQGLESELRAGSSALHVGEGQEPDHDGDHPAEGQTGPGAELLRDPPDEGPPNGVVPMNTIVYSAMARPRISGTASTWMNVMVPDMNVMPRPPVAIP